MGYIRKLLLEKDSGIIIRMGESRNSSISRLKLCEVKN